MIRRSLSLIFILLIIPLLAFLISCGGGAENQELEKVEKIRVRAINYEKAGYEFTLDFSGEVKAWKTVNLSFNVRGKIDRFYFDEGHRVNKGDLLARLVITKEAAAWGKKVPYQNSSFRMQKLHSRPRRQLSKLQS